MPVHESVIAEQRTAQQYPASRDSRSGSRLASQPDVLASGDDRFRLHDRHGPFSRQRTFREAGRPSGNREFSFRRLRHRYGDVGARGNGRGTSSCRFFWPLRRNVRAPLGRFCDSLHLLVVPGIRCRQRGGRRVHLLQVLVARSARLGYGSRVFRSRCCTPTPSASKVLANSNTGSR